MICCVGSARIRRNEKRKPEKEILRLQILKRRMCYRIRNRRQAMERITLRVPKVRHRIIKKLDKNLFLCTDARATELPAFEGSSGGGGFKYLGYQNPILKVDKNTLRLLKKASRITAKKEERHFWDKTNSA